ncbi:acyl-CoA carboxylase subunit epsilon [Streptomyces barkulensis]|uniref:acyl-CoA carboxylase subunit epsilon n=1 Tax=Streptomyces barkulensis TaxID=1257026 RepID=UPI0013042483|nr:acyl-CoA carboxylase subunit epsilon [Streptomyces barkulensis]
MTAHADPSPPDTGPRALVRVERGTPTDDELAALVVALMARASRAEPAEGEEERRHRARWRRPERVTGHRAPRSWRDETHRAVPAAGGRR